MTFRGARDGFAGEAGAAGGETQPPTGLWSALFTSPWLLVSRNSVLQHEILAQPISAGALLTFMGDKL